MAANIVPSTASMPSVSIRERGTHTCVMARPTSASTGRISAGRSSASPAQRPIESSQASAACPIMNALHNTVATSVPAETPSRPMPATRTNAMLAIRLMTPATSSPIVAGMRRVVAISTRFT